jgi:hypothetical protein
MLVFDGIAESAPGRVRSMILCRKLPVRRRSAAMRERRDDDWLFASRTRHAEHVGAVRYARLVDGWIVVIGLEPRAKPPGP